MLLYNHPNQIEKLLEYLLIENFPCELSIDEKKYKMKVTINHFDNNLTKDIDIPMVIRILKVDNQTVSVEF